MKKLFIGLLLIFLEFNIKIGQSTLGLIPDFIGYAFVVSGLADMALENPRFEKIKPWAVVMIVYTALVYALNLLAVGESWLLLLLGLAATAVSLYISYNIVTAVREMEYSLDAFLDAEKLCRVWKLMAIFTVASHALLLIPVLNVICIIAAFVVSIVFLVAFYRSKQRYEDTRGMR